jgi:predicted MFS family arabinose efflux permease
LYFIKLDESFLIGVRFLSGLSIGITTTIVGTIVALVIPQHRKGEGISYFAISTALATGLGPFIGISLTKDANFINIFFVSLLFGIISFIFSFLLNVPSNNNKKELSFRNLLSIKTLPIAFIIFLSAFSFSGIVSYINLYAIKIDLVQAASFFFIVYTISVLFSRPFTGKIVDLRGPSRYYVSCIYSFLSRISNIKY